VAKRKSQKPEELNLVPIMNLVTILIPVLLVAIKSVELTIIDTTLPPISSNAPAPDQEDPNPPLNLKLRVTNKGIWICGADKYIDVLDPQCECKRNPNITCEGGLCKDTKSYKWDELKNNLLMIKEGAEKDNREGRENVIFEPATNVRYETLIRMMDVSREDPTQEVVVKDKNDNTVKSESGQDVTEFRRLFPNVVMSAVQTQQ
jgi:biopolymer transport protein ExbD